MFTDTFEIKDKIIVDTDPVLNYETNSVAKKFFNFFFIPILNSLPASARNFVKKSNKSADEVVKNATNHAALEVLYNSGHPKKHKSLAKFFNSVWFNTNNPKAVRNRIRLVKRELEMAIDKLAVNKNHISLLSIASGSARAVIEVLDLYKASNLTFSITLLDKNPAALEYSKQLAEILDKNRFNIQWIEGTAGTYLRNNKQKFDIIEMVGLLDYFDDQKAIEIFTEIHAELEDNGIFITANICNNRERKFITKVIGWDMVYRSAEELAQLLEVVGFEVKKMKIFYEPLKIHTVIVSER